MALNEDIGEKVLNYFQNSTNNSENSNGHAWRGFIVHATGSVLHPRMNIENSSAFNKGPCNILTLGGRYTISEDGQVQEHGPLMISISNTNWVVVGGQVIGRLVAAGNVQVVVFTIRYKPSEDEDEV
ncbi:hypothetical protein HAX54_004029 [Datura stramonium]|uniref:AT-hook motif nuclear-localized protein n=1 Tax=Datura stramonium TaxID=4076 RepID=A0ABS8T6B5_DATST|nr:hypothetical protein [Datura stramonium]